MEEEDANRNAMLAAQNANTIKLSDLLDFAIQQVFHEITVLSELLPKKMDQDRKISLVQFAHATRNLFIKLLALVKWVKSSRKFESCSSISYFLDHQGFQFIETADKLLEMSHSLTLARLPHFEVQMAVDVLTTRSFTRLPLCIKESFIKEKKISPRDQAMVLKRLNQVIQYRLSLESPKLSPRITELRIRNGYLTMVVPGEFEVQLTLLGDRIDMSWTLLNIKMLVEDYDVGYGTTLVHPMQLNELHNILQSRIEAVEQPLAEVYTVLHSLAQSLQLDVLYCQATQLAAGRLRERIVIEAYDAPKRVLTIGYWVSRVSNAARTHINHIPDYHIVIYGNTYDENELHVKHIPRPVDCELGTVDCRPGRLSIENLLAKTFLVRCRERLLKIRKKIEAAEPKAMLALRGESIPYLYFPLLRDSVEDEQEFVVVSVNTYTGRVLVNLPALEENYRADIDEMEKALYEYYSTETLRANMDKLKVSLMMERYRKAVSTSPVRIISEAQMAPILKKIESVPKNRICLQFVKEDHYYLVVSFKADEALSVTVGLFLISTADDTIKLIELNQNASGSSSIKSSLGVTEPLQRIIDLESNTYGEKNFDDCDWDSMRKDANKAATALRQLGPYIAAVDDRLAFLRVCMELEKKMIQYKKIEEEPTVGGLVLHITDLSSVLGPGSESNEFIADMKRCCLRLDNRARGQWPFECCLTNPPLFRDVIRDFETHFKSSSVCTSIQDLSSGGSDGVATLIADRMVRYKHTYEIVHKFSKAYNAYYHKFCNVVTYTYHKLIIVYGANRDQLLVVSFQPRSPERERFKITFGHILPRCGKDPVVCANHCPHWNPHCTAASILMSKFNKDANLIELVHYLVTTTTPLYALTQFTRIRFLSIKVVGHILGQEVAFPLKLKFLLIVVNDITLRLIYSDLHLEVLLLENDQVAVRDCCRQQPRIAGIHQFFSMISGGTAKVCRQPGTSGGTAQPKTSPYQQHLTPGPTGQGPPSLPPHLGSPAVDPSVNTNLLSAPPLMEGHSPRSQEPARTDMSGTDKQSRLPCTAEPTIISHETLLKACSFTVNSDGILHAPLEEYLNGLVFLRRIRVALDCHRHRSVSGRPDYKYYSNLLGGSELISSFTHDFDHVTATIPALPIPGLPTLNITFHFYIDPVTMMLRVKITYAGENAPNDHDVAAFEEYFEKHVLRLNNEVAVCAFMQLCRITPKPAANALAQLLLMQMEPNAYSTCRFMIQLVYSGNDGHATISRRYSSAVITNEQQQQMLILFVFRKPANANVDKVVIKTLFSATANTIKQTGTEDETVQSIFSAANQESAQKGTCPLYVAARQLFERYSSGASGTTAGPASVGVGNMPSSVSTSSVGGPGSAAGMGSTSAGGPGQVMGVGSGVGGPGQPMSASSAPNIGSGPGGGMGPGTGPSQGMGAAPGPGQGMGAAPGPGQGMVPGPGGSNPGSQAGAGAPMQMGNVPPLGGPSQGGFFNPGSNA